MMKVLVFNCGSSSLKYRLIQMPGERELAGGEAQRVGPPTAEPARIYHSVGGGKPQMHYAEMPDHSTAFVKVMKLLATDGLTCNALGHRVVHGGVLFSQPTVMNEASIARLETISDLAPLHNPPALNLIRSSRKMYPDLSQVAVFDTAFHATIPDYAYTYAIPQDLRRKYNLRKYGFHGTSHEFVVEEAARMLQRPLSQFSAVSCHLGSGGASLCAVVNGRSIDNTMGYSPLQGLIMSTRCGDIDPALTLSLLAYMQGSEDSVEKILNKQSGLLALSGLSGDIRDILAQPGKEARADRTAEIYLWRIRKYLGAYLTLVGHAEAVIFTDTIGENVPEVRERVCRGLEVFGLKIDPDKNQAASVLPCDVSVADSRIRIPVVRTNEELAIARRVYTTLAHGLEPLVQEKQEVHS
jgi:acetate kinase